MGTVLESLPIQNLRRLRLLKLVLFAVIAAFLSVISSSDEEPQLPCNCGGNYRYGMPGRWVYDASGVASWSNCPAHVRQNELR